MKLIKPISNEDKKILLTDSYYTRLKSLPQFWDGVVKGRFSSSDIEKIRETIEYQNVSFNIISLVMHAPFFMRHLLRGKRCIEFEVEQSISLAKLPHNLDNFIYFILLFNYVSQNFLKTHIFKYNIYFLTLYDYINEEIGNFPINILEDIPKLLYILESIHKQQELWISKLCKPEIQASKSNLEIDFDHKRRNTDKLLSKFSAGIDNLLKANNSIMVLRFDLKYQHKINKFQYQKLFTAMEKDRSKLLTYLRKKYQKVGKYYGFIWKVNFDHEYNLSLHLIVFFSEYVIAEDIIRDIKYTWNQKITQGSGSVDYFFHHGYAQDYVENNLIDYKYYGTGIVRKDNHHDRLRLIQACRYVVLPQLYLSFDLIVQDKSCTFVDKKPKSKLVYSIFY